VGQKKRLSRVALMRQMANRATKPDR